MPGIECEGREWLVREGRKDDRGDDEEFESSKEVASVEKKDVLFEKIFFGEDEGISERDRSRQPERCHESTSTGEEREEHSHFAGEAVMGLARFEDVGEGAP